MSSRLRAGVALVAVLLAGCAADAEVVRPPAATGLLGALAGVRATDESSALIEYGDVAAVRALVAVDRPRFGTLLGHGYPDLAPVRPELVDLVGFDPSQATTALKVGRPPTWAAVLRVDVDVAAVDARIAALGGRRESGTWTTAGDGETRLDGPLARAGVITGFQRLRVDAGSVAHSPTGEALRWITEPGDRSLAEDPMIGELARCLGEVTAAMIGRPRSGLSVAVGVRTTPTGGATGVVCVPDENPNALANRVRTNLRNPTWSAAFPRATAEQPADQTGVVRVLVPTTPDTGVDRVLTEFRRGGLPALFS